MNEYVHGYSEREAQRLNDQANSIAELLHYDSIWPAGSMILEAGCGVGAQTQIIAPKNLQSQFVSIDISPESIAEAKIKIAKAGINNVSLNQANIFNLPFDDESFDHIFLCFVLEHLSNTTQALKELKRVLKTNGTITVIEGDHGSTYFHPDSPKARKAVQCQVLLQQQKGGDANIGRRLYPILASANFEAIKVSPRQVYVDDSKPELVEGFTKNTFTAMIEGIAEDAITQQLISRQEMQKGINDLLKTAAGGGTFCYTFFKAVGVKTK